MFKNTGSQKVIVFAFDSTTNSPKTGDAANITAYVSKDYGSVTVLGDTSATEMEATNAKGYYLFDITQTETNADILMVSAKSSTSNIVVIGAPAVIHTSPPNFGVMSIDSNGRLDVIKLAGTTNTARDLGLALPAVAPGTAGGLLFAGANLATSFVGTAASGATPAVAALTITGGAASTTGGGVASEGLKVVGGAGAGSTNGAVDGATFAGGGTNTVASTASGIKTTGTSTGHGLLATSGGGTTGDGIKAISAATNGNGIEAVGIGTGSGELCTAGATGHGVKYVGGATSGDGMNTTAATSGKGINAAGAGTTMPGMLLTGGTTTSAGLSIVGGGTTGDGILIATTSGHGINCSGAGTTKHGALFTGGATTSAGVAMTGGATSGDGLLISAPTLGHGMSVTGAGASKHGIMAVSGSSSGNGLNIVGGSTSGAGISITTTSGDGISVAPTAGHGLNLAANGTSKHGILSTGGTGGTSDGASFAAGTGGVDFRANQTGNLVGTVSTLTTYTGNTPQTGDNFARLGAPAGASVSADIAAAKVDTAAIKVQTDKMAFTVANQIDANVLKVGGTTQTARDLGSSVLLSSGTGTGQLDFTSGVVKASLAQILGTAFTEGAAGRIAAAFKQFFNVASPASTMELITAVTTTTTATTATNLTNAPTAGDFTAAMKTSLNAATPAVTVSDKTGFSLSSGGVQAIWDALTSALTTVGSIGKLLVTNIDTTISSRSSYAGGDTSGTTTLLSRLTSTRAGLLDNLDAAVSTRLASASYTAPDNTSITSIKAKTDNLPASPAGVGDAMTLTAAYNFAKGNVTITESYAAAGDPLTPIQALYQINQHLGESSIASTTKTVKKRDSSTTAKTFTLDDDTNPTSITETT